MNTASYPNPDADRSAAPDMRSEMTKLPPPSCVRVLLSIDVPARLLPEIKADWQRVAEARENAPDLVATTIASALGRLQEQVVNVGGAGFIERWPSPFPDWMMQRAAELAA